MILPIPHLKRILPESWLRRLRLIARRLPMHWFYLTNDRRLWWLTGVADEMRNRVNLVRYDLQEGCFLETYRADRIGPEGVREFGAAAMLVVHGSEIMKFDCYGYPAGHYHVATPYPHGIRKGLTGRIWLSEKTAEEQVDRAIFELVRNAGYCLQTHPRRKVRSTCFSQQRLAAVCEQMKTNMLEEVKH